jgi:inward rectifier potassium channel
MTKSTQRLFSRSGQINAVRIGLSKNEFHDLYHKLLSGSLWRLLAFLMVGYFGVNLVFAILYSLCGHSAIQGVDGEGAQFFFENFFFSVQTLSTIGYGRVAPVSFMANVIASFEAFFGMLLIAIGSGLLFARFSRPTARVLFSKNALINFQDGERCLVFRMANCRLNQIVEAQISLILVRDEVTAEGEHYRNFFELELERTKTPAFVMSLTAVHPINARSPLFGKSIDQLREVRAEIIATLTGTDDTFNQTIHARFSYTPDEILEGQVFEDMLIRRADGILEVRLDLIDHCKKSG